VHAVGERQHVQVPSMKRIARLEAHELAADATGDAAPHLR